MRAVREKVMKADRKPKIPEATKKSRY